jgi:hypothetical protein
MPIVILIIMKNQVSYFKTAATLTQRIDEYFRHIEGEYHIGQKPIKPTKEKTETTAEHKVWDREPEPSTISGLALFLDFSSRHEFETYEENGKYADILKRGRLRVEATYEAMLHQTPTGAMFALKSMGWNEKSDINSTAPITENTLTIKIINSGPVPVSSEKDVTL